MHRPAAQSNVLLHVAGNILRIGDDRHGPVHSLLDVSQFAFDVLQVRIVQRPVQKVQIVNRQQNRNARVQRQVSRCLMGHVPKAHCWLWQQGLHQWPHQPQQGFLPPQSHIDPMNCLTRKILIGGLWHQEHRLQASLGCLANLTAEMEGKPSQSAVHVADFFEIDHNPRQAIGIRIHTALARMG